MRYIIVVLLVEIASLAYCEVPDPLKKVHCPNKTVSVMAAVMEPYVLSPNRQSKLHRGVLNEILMSTLANCFPKCSTAQNVTWTYVEKWQDLADAISERKANFYLPMTTPMHILTVSNHSLKNKVKTSDGVAESPGFFYIVDEAVYNARTKAQHLSDLVKMWPALVLSMLLAGTSGVLIWVLVRRQI